MSVNGESKISDFNRGEQEEATEQQSVQDTSHASSHAEFTTAFDIIDALQQMLGEAKPVMFSQAFVKIDHDQFSNELDELKKVLPVQLERASALMRESEHRLQNANDKADSILRNARTQADQIIQKANEQADFLAGHQNVIAIATQKAKNIVDEAQAQADRITAGANEYSSLMLTGLGEELSKLQRDVNGGLTVLQSRQQQAAARLRAKQQNGQEQQAIEQ